MTIPVQPPGAGYGAIAGAQLRYDPYSYQSGNDPQTGEPVYTAVTAVHQINTAEANPSIYLPQMAVIPGDTWRFSYRTLVDLVAAAGEPQVQLAAEWYDAAGTMIHEDATPFQTVLEARVMDPNGVQSWWQPTLEAEVPPNAATVHVVTAMQCVSPVNAWALFKVSYEPVP